MKMVSVTLHANPLCELVYPHLLGDAFCFCRSESPSKISTVAAYNINCQQ